MPMKSLQVVDIDLLLQVMTLEKVRGLKTDQALPPGNFFQDHIEQRHGEQHLGIAGQTPEGRAELLQGGLGVAARGQLELTRGGDVVWEAVTEPSTVRVQFLDGFALPL